MNKDCEQHIFTWKLIWGQTKPPTEVVFLIQARIGRVVRYSPIYKPQHGVFVGGAWKDFTMAALL